MFSNIQRIDFEFHSLCNRSCEWCPNSFISRGKENFLDLNVFKNIIQELYDNNFSTKYYYNGAFKTGAIISFLGYQEPLMQVDELKKYIKIIKDIFVDRNVVILTNSNGDLFSEENLQDLNLSILNIMDYDCQGKEYWKKKLKENKCILINDSGYILSAIHKNINLIQVTVDWPKNRSLENRGGSLDPSKLSEDLSWVNDCGIRDYPCPEASYYINITHDGYVMPCCHLRADNDNHKDYILGNVYENTLSDIFYGEKASNFRKIMTHSNYKNYFPPCKNCHKKRKINFEFKDGEEFPRIIQRNAEKYEEKKLNKEEELSDSHIYLRNRKTWSENQLRVWEQSKKYYLREVFVNGKLYPNSYYNINNLWYDSQRAKDLYYYYTKNWEILANFYEYFYIDGPKANIVDDRGGISFSKFSFTKDSLINEFLNNRGFYQPYLAYKEKNLGCATIVAGRHRLAALEHMKKNNMEIPIKTICYYLDSYDPNFEDWIYFPKDLYDNILKDLNLNVKEFNENYYLIQVSNAVDIWILMKILEKEVDFLIEYYFKDVMKDGITPSKYFNIELNQN